MKKLVCLSTMVLFLSLAASATAQEVAEDWIAAWDNPGAAVDIRLSSPQQQTVDAAGNTILTGQARGGANGFDLLLVKYDAAGAEQWAQQIDGARHDNDDGRAVVTDGAGNIYVTGILYDTAYERIVTIKFAPDGTELWRQVFEDTSRSSSYDIALGPADSVYVAGYANPGVGTSDDFLLLRYSTDGLLLGDSWWDGPGGSTDRAFDLAVDATGNAYLAGITNSASSGYDQALVRFHVDGSFAWEVTFTGSGALSDSVSDLALDSLGNPILTGAYRLTSTNTNWITHKYMASTGTHLWSAAYGSSSWDNPTAIAVDGGDNVIVTGYTDLGANRYIATLKYDSGGNPVFEETWNGGTSNTSQGEDLAVDAAGNIYVTGWYNSPIGYWDYATLKYDPAGALLWAQTHGGNSNGADQGRAISLDPSDRPIVTGVVSAGSIDVVDFLRYDTSGNQEWLATYIAPGSGNDKLGYGYRSMYVDAASNIYLVGVSDGFDTGADLWAAKYDASGSLIWASRYDSPSSSSDYGRALAVDATGNVLIAGRTEGAATGQDCLVVKLNADGSFAWEDIYDGGLGQDDYCESVAVDGAGNAYVPTSAHVSGLYSDIVLIKYTPAGARAWQRTYNGPANNSDSATSITVDAAGNPHLGGYTYAGGTGFNFVTIKYDSAGNLLWDRIYDGPGHSSDTLSKIVLDSAGNVYVTGYSVGLVGTDYGTVKYDPDGNQLWVARYDGPALGYDNPSDLEVDSLGNVYVTGVSEATGTKRDYATVKYNAAGALQWVARLDGPFSDNDYATDLALDGDGNVYVTGQVLVTYPDLDYATVKYDPAGSQIWIMRYDGGLNEDDEGVTVAVTASGQVVVAGQAYSPATNYDVVTILYDQSVPDATDDNYVTDEDQQLVISAPGVLTNDSDPNPSHSLSVSGFDALSDQGGTVTLNADGSGTYDPPANYSGLDYFSYTVSDNLGLSASATVHLVIDPTNDPPSAANDVASVLEESGATSIDVLGNDTFAPDLGETLSVIAVTQPANGSAAVGGGGTHVTYQPDPDFAGIDTFSYTLSDGNGGTDTATVTVTVSGINDAPGFNAGPNQVSNEDAGPQTFAAWATAIIPGPTDEAGQTLTFVVTNDNNPLFAIQPAVAPNGALSFTTAPNAVGSALVTVVLEDDGGTANGGVDTSAPQTFTITVNPVNDPPSFTPGADPTVPEDSGAQTLPGWATALSPGPADESGQSLGFSVTGNTAPGLFAVQPALAPNGTLTFTPADDASGIATITVVLQDDGGTASGGQDTSAPASFDITIEQVNDAPVFSKGIDVQVLEDAGPSTFTAWASGMNPGPVDESGQTMTFLVTGNTDPTLFMFQPAVAPDGTLTFAPSPNRNGSADITLVIQDDGGVAAGGVDTSAPQTFTITVNPVNDPPSFTLGADPTVPEDSGAQTLPGWATALSPGPADESGQSLGFSVTGNTAPGLFAVQPALAPNGTLTFTPADDASGIATITVVLQDDGGTASGGQDTSAPVSFNITIEQVNDAPVFGKGIDVQVLEDAGPSTFTAWASGMNPGPVDESGQTMTFLVTGNTDPTLFMFQPAVAPDGTLTFAPSPNRNGSADITLVIQDDGGVAAGGVDTSAPQTFTITVVPVNDPPSFASMSNIYLIEDGGAYSGTWADSITAGPVDEAGQSLSFSVTNNTDPSLFSVQPSVAPDGTMTFTLADDAAGQSFVTVQLSDDGGVANGGDDTSNPQVVRIAVTQVNDAPSFVTGGDVQVLEDAGAQSLPGWATAISPGPANESTQSLQFQVLGNTNPALFAAEPALAADGTLTFTPAPDQNGSADITIQLMDSGGTSYGGQNTSSSEVFTITVGPVNDPPSFAAPASVEVSEDLGDYNAAFASAITAGPTDEAGQGLTFTVTANSNPGLFEVAPQVIPNGTLSFRPAADAFGSADLTLVLADDGGVADGGQDTSAAWDFTITVLPINDAPSFTAGADVQALEDAGDQTIAAWATAISAGPSNESSQLVGFVVLGNTDPALFAAGPAIAADGTLTFTPAPDRNGVASITFALTDDGGSADGGADSSAPETFVITIGAVNDAPSFTKGADVAAVEDGGAQLFPNWAFDLSAGPVDEAGQSLAFQITQNSAPDLFTTPPAIALDGSLSFASAPDAFGTADIGVVIIDSGGTADGGVDTSAEQTFTITITPVNDAPSFGPVSGAEALEDAGATTIAGWATDISAGPANEAGQGLVFQVIDNTRPELFAAGPAIDPASGDLSFTPSDDAFGTSLVTIQLSDDGGTADGGQDSSAARVFILSILPVNDPPTFLAGADQASAENAGPQVVFAWAGGMSAGPTNEANQLLSFLVVANDNPDLFLDGPMVDAASGDLLYTAVDNTSGVANLGLVLRDNGGSDNGGQDSSALAAFTVTVVGSDDPPLAVADAYVLEEDGLLEVAAPGVLDNDLDPDLDLLTTELVSDTTYGTLALGSDGSFTYAPDADFSGQDVFSYRALSTDQASDPVEVTLEVVPVNDPPAFVDPTPAADGTLTGTDGVELTFTLLAEDVDGDTLTYAVEGLPDSADFDPDSGAFTWTPTWDEAGTYPLVLSASDGLLSDAREITLDIAVTDGDEDGLPDAWEAEHGLATDSADSDGDGIADGEEVGDVNDPLDTDGDDELDALEADSDGDGVSDADEAGDSDLATAAVDTDDDGLPDYRDPDSDDDGVEDGSDNCRTVANPEQDDLDGDGIGDACEDDLDGDGVADEDDNCPRQANPDQLDADHDGFGTACDPDEVDTAGNSSGCGGCSTGGAPAPAGLLLFGLLLVFLRRRR